MADQIFVIDHLLEIESRKLYLSRGFSGLFDYVARGLGYSAAGTEAGAGAGRLGAEGAGGRAVMLRVRAGARDADRGCAPAAAR